MGNNKYKRNDAGEPVREPAPGSSGKGDVPTKLVSAIGKSTARQSHAGGDVPTTVNNEDAGERDGDKTKLHGLEDALMGEAPGEERAGPVVGWLAVVSGPGRGQSLTLGVGRNTVGRGSNADIAVDFGDETISRGAHCSIVYDHKGRRFYLAPGNGVNLTYVDGEPVLAAVDLPDRSRIAIGDTVLMFVGLCDGRFDWQDAAE